MTKSICQRPFIDFAIIDILTTKDHLFTHIEYRNGLSITKIHFHKVYPTILHQTFF